MKYLTTMTVLMALGVAFSFVQTTTTRAETATLHMIVCGDYEWGGEAAERHIGKWEAANPSYSVELEYVPWGQCQEKSKTLAAAGKPPALAYMGSRTLKQLAQNDLIVPIAMSDEEKASYAAPILATVTANGQVWGAPRAFSTKALFWNKDLFAAAGLDPETPPKTWDEMYTFASTVKEKTDADGFGLSAASFNNTMHQFMNYVYTNGGEVIDADGEIVFNSPNNVEALTFYGKMAEVSEPGPIAYDRDKLHPLFNEAKIAMMITGPWARAEITDVNWDVAPIPVGPRGRPSTLLITDSLAVFKGSGMEDAAGDLARFLTSPDNQFEFEKSAGLTPLRNVAGVADLRKEDPSWGAFLDAVETGGPEPFVTDYVALEDAIIEAVQGVLLGEVKPADAIAEAARRLEEVK
ncbi:sugar ABC transporter substrate-binding protein [Nitratireductor sp. ZSWI3]|uniref:ABC transporter substrate-binding protein n=1 Tax=Nitratireductor sp. ZSWI3 TaxID=2966359 RepID=UPI002150625D|nr:sugar ABC transporter substrate-binding protein [Nitratireductor sp. ZSWI3]MCR4265807.1 sugar ABC transporter substrate-binding protein [Nitratireductor sp. ZSWI3]